MDGAFREEDGDQVVMQAPASTKALTHTNAQEWNAA